MLIIKDIVEEILTIIMVMVLVVERVKMVNILVEVLMLEMEVMVVKKTAEQHIVI